MTSSPHLPDSHHHLSPHGGDHAIVAFALEDVLRSPIHRVIRSPIQGVCTVLPLGTHVERAFATSSLGPATGGFAAHPSRPEGTRPSSVPAQPARSAHPSLSEGTHFLKGRGLRFPSTLARSTLLAQTHQMWSGNAVICMTQQCEKEEA